VRLRTSLFALVLVSAIPLAIFSLIVSKALLDQQYETFVSVVKDRNRAFMSAVDSEVRGTITTLEALASSRSLNDDTLRRFHEEAEAALATQPQWVNLLLLSVDGRQLVNAGLPWGTALPQRPQQPDTVEPVTKTAKPVVGNVLDRGPFLQRTGIPVRVPVIRKGTVAYVLTAVMKPESFDSLFEAQRIPAGWVTGIVDAQGRFIARVPARPVGSPAGKQYLEAVAGDREGWFRGRTVEGLDTFTAYTRSDLTHWSLGFAIPAEMVLGGVRRATWLAAGGLGLILLAGLLLAFWLSRRIASPLTELSNAAASLGTSEAELKPRSRIWEIRQLGRSLNDASRAILARDSELRRQASELQRADSNKSQFLALLSHELRNPLAPLLNALALLKQRRDPETSDRMHSMMERQIGHLRRLIDDLLDVSRIDRGKIELHKDRIAVDSVVRNAIETAKPNMEAKQHRLVVNYAREPLYVEADPVRLSQVIANLLNNAAKFTPSGGHIEISMQAEGATAKIRVKDNGTGFPPADAGRIFEMFVQLDASAAGGLGLGLTLSRSLVEMQDGTLTATSAGQGHGSEFTIVLPMSYPPAKVEVYPILQSPRGGNKVHLLVVDDNADAADSLAEVLRAQGFGVEVAYSGEEALQRARETKPEVIFLDLNMPSMSGIELAKMLRGEAWAANIRIAALTGMGQKSDIDNTNDAGFDAHFTKPAAPDALLRFVIDQPTNVIALDGRRTGA
jgi:signal transduction histidine kinase/CheY-like chemotaxis protein